MAQVMLLGPFGSAVPTARPMSDVESFLLQHPDPSISDVARFLRSYSTADRGAMARALLDAGVPSGTVSAAMSWLGTTELLAYRSSRIIDFVAILSAAFSGYHGYRRNQSIGWGVAWFVLGGLFPVVTPVIAIAQGFGQRKAA